MTVIYGGYWDPEVFYDWAGIVEDFDAVLADADLDVDGVFVLGLRSRKNLKKIWGKFFFWKKNLR